MAGAEPEERVTLPMVRQDWRDVAMLHWRYPPDVIAAMLPPGLEPDVRDGSAWVSLTPFSVRRFRPGVGPPLPGVSDFPETNLRTYALGPGGLDGIVFFTLEVDSLVSVSARGIVGAPYRWAHMSVDEYGGMITYRSKRRDDATAGHDITVRPRPGDVDDRGLADWLAGRWRAWTRMAGRLAAVPVEHQPWPLQPAVIERCDESLLAACGLPVPAEQPLVHYAAGVDAKLGFPRFA